MRARVIVAVALAALGITACIIGPKQDDPATLIDPGVDGSTAVDTAPPDTADRATDGSPASVTEGGTDATTESDARADADADALTPSDAASDASDAAEGG